MSPSRDHIVQVVGVNRFVGAQKRLLFLPPPSTPGRLFGSSSHLRDGLERQVENAVLEVRLVETRLTSQSGRSSRRSYQESPEAVAPGSSNVVLSHGPYGGEQLVPVLWLESRRILYALEGLLPVRL